MKTNKAKPALRRCLWTILKRDTTHCSVAHTQCNEDPHGARLKVPARDTMWGCWSLPKPLSGCLQGVDCCMTDHRSSKWWVLEGGDFRALSSTSCFQMTPSVWPPVEACHAHSAKMIHGKRASLTGRKTHGGITWNRMQSLPWQRGFYEWFWQPWTNASDLLPGKILHHGSRQIHSRTGLLFSMGHHGRPKPRLGLS
jgi:hypothetical protein